MPLNVYVSEADFPLIQRAEVEARRRQMSLSALVLESLRNALPNDRPAPLRSTVTFRWKGGPAWADAAPQARAFFFRKAVAAARMRRHCLPSPFPSSVTHDENGSTMTWTTILDVELATAADLDIEWEPEVLG